MLYKKLYKEFLLQNVKKYCTKVKPQIELNEEVAKSVDKGLYKPRKHPGIFRPKTIDLPEQFIKAAEKALQDYPAKQLLESGKKLTNYMFSRHPPIENMEFNMKKKEIYEKLESKFINPDKSMTEEQAEKIESKLKKNLIKKLKQNVHHWKPIQYDVYTSLEYLLGRSAAEYAVLVRTFQEISNRDPEFKPRTFFDFGSGVGMGTWAAKLFWQKYLYEYFNVDASADMNELALILLKGGTGMGQPNIKGVYYRQFLPATNTSYDLVMSSYTLLELPSSQARLETILKLWNKTEKYLVLIEVGSNAGFKVISEARDFILNIKDEHQKTNEGHVFAPCPHDLPCPRYLTDTTPCNFEIQYNKIPIGQNLEVRRERYCYVVLKKGKPDENKERWPRIVRPTLVRSKHAICRMCTADGKLQEIIFTTSKQGQIAYRCAKSCEWGDLVPIKISPQK